MSAQNPYRTLMSEYAKSRRREAVLAGLLRAQMEITARIMDSLTNESGMVKYSFTIFSSPDDISSPQWTLKEVHLSRQSYESRSEAERMAAQILKDMFTHEPNPWYHVYPTHSKLGG